MKTRLLAGLFAASLLFFNLPSSAAGTNEVSTELQDLIAKVKAKLQAGKDNEADLAGELKMFDALVAKHSSEKTDEVANILVMKAMLYLEVLNDPDKGADTIRQLKRDFPKTAPAQKADEILAQIDHAAAAKKVQAALKEGTQFPPFEEKDLAGKPLSISNYKGKVVLVDFWATWCGPCRGELPNVLNVYQKHHGDGFEIIGVSLDEDRDKLESFTKENKMVWPQFFDGKGWGNELAVKYGIQSIPATYLLDGQGKIIGQNLRGDSLEEAVGKALAKK